MNPPIWQPIETAPKDGTEVLVGWYSEKGHFENHVWQHKGWLWEWAVASYETDRWSDWECSLAEEPTHWMPLPPPPSDIPQP